MERERLAVRSDAFVAALRIVGGHAEAYAFPLRYITTYHHHHHTQHSEKKEMQNQQQQQQQQQQPNYVKSVLRKLQKMNPTLLRILCVTSWITLGKPMDRNFEQNYRMLCKTSRTYVPDSQYNDKADPLAVSMTDSEMREIHRTASVMVMTLGFYDRNWLSVDFPEVYDSLRDVTYLLLLWGARQLAIRPAEPEEPAATRKQSGLSRALGKLLAMVPTKHAPNPAIAPPTLPPTTTTIERGSMQIVPVACTLQLKKGTTCCVTIGPSEDAVVALTITNLSSTWVAGKDPEISIDGGGETISPGESYHLVHRVAKGGGWCVIVEAVGGVCYVGISIGCVSGESACVLSMDVSGIECEESCRLDYRKSKSPYVEYRDAEFDIAGACEFFDQGGIVNLIPFWDFKSQIGLFDKNLHLQTAFKQYLYTNSTIAAYDRAASAPASTTIYRRPIKPTAASGTLIRNNKRRTDLGSNRAQSNKTIRTSEQAIESRIDIAQEAPDDNVKSEEEAEDVQ